MEKYKSDIDSENNVIEVSSRLENGEVSEVKILRGKGLSKEDEDLVKEALEVFSKCESSYTLEEAEMLFKQAVILKEGEKELRKLISDYKERLL